MHLQFLETDRVLSEHIAAVIATRGVPESPAAAQEIAEDLLGPVVGEVRRLHALEVRQIQESHPGVQVPRWPDFVPVEYMREVVHSTANVHGLDAVDLEAALLPKLGQIARSGSRSTVLRAAEMNRMRWGRQVPEKHCYYCNWLATRGAVRGVTKFRAHDGCDCTAVLVADPRGDWDGKEKALYLRGLWESCSGRAEFEERLRKETVLA